MEIKTEVGAIKLRSGFLIAGIATSSKEPLFIPLTAGYFMS